MTRTAEAPPVPAVCIAVWHDEMVLLVRRGREPNKDLWALPGGKVDPGETILEAAKRELFEETNLRAELHDIFHRKEIVGAGFHYQLHCLSAVNPAGELRAGDDASEARWYSPDDIATLQTVPGLTEILRRSRADSPPAP
uniref:NUDIX hydrolase n=1 Tax=Pararhizobium sp. IMCC3301 TaxID=3067904 RepID=UPI002741F5CA|nr:NUDIX hydrolase [Pararhizobium sp. IMCC3301]